MCRASLHVTGIDFSKEIIEVARESCQEKNISFYLSPGEDLPLPDESFDAVVCFATFDGMYQTKAHLEMNRVCRVGAKVLITGKNADYSDDDTAALEAELGARA